MKTAPAQEPKPLFLRARDVQRLTGLSGSTLWRLEKAGKFPQRRKLGNCSGWIYSEVEAAINAAPKG